MVLPLLGVTPPSTMAKKFLSPETRPSTKSRSEKVNDNTFTSVLRKTDGKYHMTGRTVISKDGKTSTLTSKGTNADGKPATQTIVSEKQ